MLILYTYKDFYSEYNDFLNKIAFELYICR